MKSTNLNIILSILKEEGINRHVICPSINQCTEVLQEINAYFPNAVHSIDERSAGYIATGMSAEAQDVVVVWCDGNASFRNLTSALTEAFYRKLPILVLTLELSGEAIDQSVNPHDILCNRYCIPKFTNRDFIKDVLSHALECIHGKIVYPVLVQIADSGQELTIQESDRVTSSLPDDNTCLTKLIPSGSVLVVGKSFASSCWHETNADMLIEPLEGMTADGRFSILLGSAVVDKDTLHIGVVSVDEITYDLNMIGNRHVSNNICLVVPRQKKFYSTNLSDYARSLGWVCSVIENKDSQLELKIAKAPQLIEVTI